MYKKAWWCLRTPAGHSAKLHVIFNKRESKLSLVDYVQNVMITDYLIEDVISNVIYIYYY